VWSIVFTVGNVYCASSKQATLILRGFSNEHTIEMDKLRVCLVSEYKQDILRFLLEEERKLGSLGDFLPRNDIEPWMRDKLAQWVLDQAGQLMASSHTAQFAVTILNIFLKRVTISKRCLQLLGVVSLMIALKTQDSLYYDLDRAFIDGGRLYKRGDIIATELYVMQTLNWNLSFPTAAELSRQLVYITDVQYNFKEVLDRSDAFAVICYADYQLVQFRPLTIALVSVICALELIRQYRFKNDWLYFIISKIELDLHELDRCKAGLVAKLMQDVDDGSKLKNLVQESLVDLLATIQAERTNK